jgi:hypothetical protein
MKRLLFIFLVIQLLPGSLYAQSNKEDFGWWNELHDWQEGDPGWKNYMKITPGYLGPNGLPVPEVKKGILIQKTELRITASNHFHPGDPTQDLSAELFIPFVKSKVAIEMFGVFYEKFAFSDEIRNERFARIEDGKGTAIGDFYFNTLIQLTRNRKFPNTLLRFGTKTASGNMLDGARYSDTPGYYFDLSFSKKIGKNDLSYFLPFGLFGFYAWQTMDDRNLQNDAYMYAIGFDYVLNSWNFSTSCSGYTGYKEERDKPMQLNFDVRKDLKRSAFRFQYNYGIRHWDYKTIRFSYILKMNPIN